MRLDEMYNYCLFRLKKTIISVILSMLVVKSTSKGGEGMGSSTLKDETERALTDQVRRLNQATLASRRCEIIGEISALTELLKVVCDLRGIELRRFYL